MTGDTNPVDRRYEDYTEVFEGTDAPFWLPVIGNHEADDNGGFPPGDGMPAGNGGMMPGMGPGGGQQGGMVGPPGDGMGQPSQGQPGQGGQGAMGTPPGGQPGQGGPGGGSGDGGWEEAGQVCQADPRGRQDAGRAGQGVGPRFRHD